MGGLVTKQSLSKYEHERAQPSAVVAARLARALGVSVADLIRAPSVAVEFLAFRRASSLSKRELARTEGVVAGMLEARVHLQDLVRLPNGPNLRVRRMAVATVDDAEEAARTMRGDWQIGLAPITSVTDLLEHHRVHVISIETGERFDGMAALARDRDGEVRAAGVVTRRGLPGERQRRDLCHELGHLVLDPASGVDAERAAFRFAGAFLVPAAALFAEVGETRTAIDVRELLLLKRQFGISMQALLYRLRDLSIITERHYEFWCIEINRRGWRKREPAELPAEEPRWAYQAALRALSEGLIGPEEAAALTDGAVRAPVPEPLVRRRALMAMPLEERRRVLARQAESLDTLYPGGASFSDLETGDLAPD